MAADSRKFLPSRAGVKTRALRLANSVTRRSHSFRDLDAGQGVRTGSTTLDLGSGPDPRNPFRAETVFGVDIVDFGAENVRVADLARDPIPFPDNSMDYITAFDFLEHIPRLIYIGTIRRAPFIEVMNEVHRVLRPGGVFHAQTPAFPRAEAFSDPTHVNTITEGTAAYFTDPFTMQLSKAYGFVGEFALLDQYWDSEAYYHLVWQFKAI